MEKSILNFHFDYLHPSLTQTAGKYYEEVTCEHRISLAMLRNYQICFAIKHHNDDDLLLDKDG